MECTGATPVVVILIVVFIIIVIAALTLIRVYRNRFVAPKVLGPNGTDTMSGSVAYSGNTVAFDNPMLERPAQLNYAPALSLDATPSPSEMNHTYTSTHSPSFVNPAYGIEDGNTIALLHLYNTFSFRHKSK